MEETSRMRGYLIDVTGGSIVLYFTGESRVLTLKDVHRTILLRAGPDNTNKNNIEINLTMKKDDMESRLHEVWAGLKDRLLKTHEDVRSIRTQIQKNIESESDSEQPDTLPTLTFLKNILGSQKASIVALDKIEQITAGYTEVSEQCILSLSPGVPCNLPFGLNTIVWCPVTNPVDMSHCITGKRLKLECSVNCSIKQVVYVASDSKLFRMVKRTPIEWQLVCDLPCSGSELANLVTLNDGRIYMIGSVRNVRAQSMWKYDPLTNVLTTTNANAPAQFKFVGSTVVSQGKIFDIGGKVANSILMYDEGKWDSIAFPVPDGEVEVVYKPALVERGGNIYSIGGFKPNSQPAKRVQRYDTETRLWFNLAPMLTARRNLAAVFVGGYIFTFGGYVGPGRDACQTVERYNPDTDKWCRMPDMARARTNMGIAVYDGEIYVFGGCETEPSTTECLDLTNFEWRTVDEQSPMRGDAYAVVI